MIIKYGEKPIIKEREKQAEKIFEKLPYRYCFITGSFLYEKNYNDIDVFVITRSKKKIELKNKTTIQTLDFNDLHSLFYHSSSKYCIAKNILPKKELKVTIADYWDVVNEAVTAIFNNKKEFKKKIRTLILYTEYLKDNKILDSKDIKEKIEQFKDYKEVLEYIKNNIILIIHKKTNKSYIKRFFYTQSGFYKEHINFKGIEWLYNISKEIARA